MVRKKRSKRGRGSDSTSVDFWGETAIEERERRGLSDIAKRNRRAKWLRFLITFVVFILTPLTLIALIGMFSSDDEDSDGFYAESSAPGRVEATAALTNWLETKPSPLPGAEIMMWDGASEVKYPVDDNSDADELFATWVHTFILQVPPVYSESGFEVVATRFFESSIQVAVSDVRGNEVISTPSLAPITPSLTGWGEREIWPGTTSASPPTAAVNAIEQWAKAYVGADITALKQATGDPSVSSWYMPLATGIRGVDVSIGKCATVKVSGDAEPTKMICEVTLGLDHRLRCADQRLFFRHPSRCGLGPSINGTPADRIRKRAQPRANQ